jgi:F-type H+-transporting ATPase subunit epsilon
VGGDVVRVTILNPRRVLFEGEAKSVSLTGDIAEFEILDHHAPIVSLLRPGNVTVDGTRRVPIKKGMVRFDNNECVILTE